MRAAGVDEVAMLEISCTRSHGACKAPAPSVFLDTQVKVDLMTQALPAGGSGALCLAPRNHIPYTINHTFETVRA